MAGDIQNKELKELTKQQYKYGFTTDVESESLPPGLSEDTVRWISAKKGEPEFMLNYRLKAFEQWKKMTEPTWAHVHYPKIDYQSISYFSAPKARPKSLDDVDPELLAMY